MRRLNVPNALTLSRLLLIPVFILVFLNYGPYALIVFSVASITDILDGYIARKNNIVTTFGKIADPMADKFMTITVLSCLISIERSMWIFLIFYFVKESLLAVGIIVIYRKSGGEIQEAKFLGKLAMCSTFLGLSSVFFKDLIAPWHIFSMGVAVGANMSAFLNYYDSYRSKTKRHL